jgi:hypothetical protein
VLEPFGLAPIALGAIFAVVFGGFLAEVQEEFVVREEGGLRVFDLGMLVFCVDVVEAWHHMMRQMGVEDFWVV